MAKIFGVLLIVLGVWLGLEIYTKGMDGALGGVFAGFAEPTTPEPEPLGAPAATKLRHSLETSAGRGEVDEGADPEDNN